MRKRLTDILNLQRYAALSGMLVVLCSPVSTSHALELITTTLPPQAQPSSTDPLLAKIPAAELSLARDKARVRYLRGWNKIDERSRYVRHRMLATLSALHAPESLQAVPIVESTYNPYLISHSGASGLWQLMPATAARLGIEADKKLDGRRHIDAATDAAARYLLELQDRYDSWPLALAAYNWGPNALSRRMKSSPWNPGDPISALPAPTVTREYVYEIIGLISLIHDGELSFSEPFKTRHIKLLPPVDLKRLAIISNMEEEELFRLNPSLNQAQYLTKPVDIYVPEAYFDNVWQNRTEAEPQYIQVIVKNGDTLWGLCRKHNTSLTIVKQLNRGLGKFIHIGQRLKFPAGNYTAVAANANPLLLDNHRIRYRVRNGDSLWAIAHRFGTTVTDLSRANGLSRKSTIRAGDVLWVKARTQPG